MAVMALMFLQSCSFEEMTVKPEGPQSAHYKVRIYNDIFQQPATKVTTDGLCRTGYVGLPHWNDARHCSFAW